MLQLHPAPEVPCRPARLEETPKTAQSLATEAEANGWRVSTTFARGTSLDQYGNPSMVVDSVAVRLWRSPLRVVGLWRNGKFRCGLIRVEGSRATTRVRSRQLVAVVTA